MGQAYAVEVLARSVAVPDLDAGLLEGLCRRVAGDEPEKFGDDGAEEDAFCSEEGKNEGPVGRGEFELEWCWSEVGESACSCAGRELARAHDIFHLFPAMLRAASRYSLPVRSMLAVPQNILDQVEVLELLVVRIDGLHRASELLLSRERICGLLETVHAWLRCWLGHRVWFWACFRRGSRTAFVGCFVAFDNLRGAIEPQVMCKWVVQGTKSD